MLSLYTVGYKSTGAMRGALNQYRGDESIDFFKLNTPHANLIVAKSESKIKGERLYRLCSWQYT